LFLTGPRDSGSDPCRPAQLFGAGLLSLGIPFYCIEITSEKMRGWLRPAASVIQNVQSCNSFPPIRPPAGRFRWRKRPARVTLLATSCPNAETQPLPPVDADPAAAVRGDSVPDSRGPGVPPGDSGTPVALKTAPPRSFSDLAAGDTSVGFTPSGADAICIAGATQSGGEACCDGTGTSPPLGRVLRSAHRYGARPRNRA
jgi:hypothetical protein